MAEDEDFDNKTKIGKDAGFKFDMEHPGVYFKVREKRPQKRKEKGPGKKKAHTRKETQALHICQELFFFVTEEARDTKREDLIDHTREKKDESQGKRDFKVGLKGL